MTGWRTALPLGAAFFCALTAFFVVPRGFEAQSLLLAQDDPMLLADYSLDRSFDAVVADREIRSALAANDPDLANSFRDLARERDVPVDPALVARVEAANSTTATAVRAAGTFGRGLLTGEPDDLVGLAGTALGDLFVFGDIRDAVREGSRLAKGEHADELVLGLAGIGIAVTAGTYASLGAGTPARVGLSLVKAARKTGRMTARMGEWVGRSLREVVDWTALRRALGGASLTEPAAAVRAVREAVKIEKSRGTGADVGRCRPCAKEGRHRGRARRSEDRRRSTRRVADCAPGGKQGHRDARDPQAVRTWRYLADGRCLQPVFLGFGRGADAVRILLGLQERGRAGHRTLSRTSQAA